MKHFLKNLIMFTSVLGLVAFATGCSSDSDTKRDVEYVETHPHADVKGVNAKMYQKMGNKDGMGNIKFEEKNTGLQMSVDLKDVKPNTEYKLTVYELKGCDIKKDVKSCTKTEKDIDMPMVKGDASGKIKSTYMITGLTAAELNNTKIIMSRDNANGDSVDVAWGMLKKTGMWF